MRLLSPLIAAAASALVAHAAAAQPVAATISPSQPVWYRSTLAGYTSVWTAAASQLSMSISAPPGGGAGAVTIQNLRVAAPLVFTAPGIPQAGAVDMTTTNLVLTVGPGSGLVLTGQGGAPGETLFAAPAVSGVPQGVLNYSAAGLGCLTLTAAGAPCAGPFNLGAPTPSCVISSGLINGAASPKTVQLTLRATIPLAPGAMWGSLEVWVPLQGTFDGGTPPTTCPADFNQIAGVTVADIFAFLSAWFGADQRADFNGTGGVTVADIFAFLTAWFAGC